MDADGFQVLEAASLPAPKRFPVPVIIVLTNAGIYAAKLNASIGSKTLLQVLDAAPLPAYKVPPFPAIIFVQ